MNKMTSAGNRLLKGKPKNGIDIKSPEEMILQPATRRPRSPLTQAGYRARVKR
jgi:hypothetical protein